MIAKYHTAQAAVRVYGDRRHRSERGLARRRSARRGVLASGGAAHRNRSLHDQDSTPDPAWHDMWQEREDVLVGLARVVNKGPSINNRFRCVAGWGQWYSSTRRGIRPA